MHLERIKIRTKPRLGTSLGTYYTSNGRKCLSASSWTSRRQIWWFQPGTRHRSCSAVHNSQTSRRFPGLSWWDLAQLCKELWSRPWIDGSQVVKRQWMGCCLSFVAPRRQDRTLAMFAPLKTTTSTRLSRGTSFWTDLVAGQPVSRTGWPGLHPRMWSRKCCKARLKDWSTFLLWFLSPFFF